MDSNDVEQNTVKPDYPAISLKTGYKISMPSPKADKKYPVSIKQWG